VLTDDLVRYALKVIAFLVLAVVSAGLIREGFARGIEIQARLQRPEKNPRWLPWAEAAWAFLPGTLFLFSTFCLLSKL
jgi:hypothetical protein